jgi:hypothetical protein
LIVRAAVKHCLVIYISVADRCPTSPPNYAIRTAKMEEKRAPPEAIDAMSSPSHPAHWFAYASAGYLTLLSVPLLLFPRVLLLVSAASRRVPAELTPFERYGACANALSMVALAALVLVLAGAVPVSTSPTPQPAAAGTSPFRTPAVAVATLYFAANALVVWSHASPIGHAASLLAIIHAALALWGFAVLLFADDATANRKKAGNPAAKDSSVSNFPFKSKSSSPFSSAPPRPALTALASQTSTPPQRRTSSGTALHMYFVALCRCLKR